MRRALESANVRVWVALLVPPSVFLTDLSVSYIMARWVCASGNEIALWLVSVVSIAVIVATGAPARRDLRGGGESDDLAPAPFLARTAALVWAVSLLSTLSLLVVKALVEPCRGTIPY